MSHVFNHLRNRRHLWIRSARKPSKMSNKKLTGTNPKSPLALALTRLRARNKPISNPIEANHVRIPQASHVTLASGRIQSSRQTERMAACTNPAEHPRATANMTPSSIGVAHDQLRSDPPLGTSDGHHNRAALCEVAQGLARSEMHRLRLSGSIAPALRKRKKRCPKPPSLLSYPRRIDPTDRDRAPE